MLGSILGAVAGPLIAGMFAEDDREDQQQFQVDQASAQQDKNIAMQREFAQHGIRWRVEDAKAAGVHPMYALGASGAAFAPNPVVIPGGSEGGSRHYGDAAAKGIQGLIAALFSANQAKDLALSQSVTSNAALANTVAQSSTPFPRDFGDLGDEFNVDRWQRFGAVPMNLQNAVDSQQYVPDQRVSTRSSNSGISAATGRPEAMEVTTPGGLRMLMPQAQTAAEAHESLSESPLEHLRWIQLNASHYGDGWTREYLRQYPGAKQLIEIGESVGGAAADAADYIKRQLSRFGQYNRDRRVSTPARPYSFPRWDGKPRR